MAFVKGQSGNPGGRAKLKLPDGKTLNELAREYTLPAVQALVRIMQDETAPPAAVVAAAAGLLDRGWGRPTQMIAGDTPDGAIVHRIEIVSVEP